jgi:hypothetical protein
LNKSEVFELEKEVKPVVTVVRCCLVCAVWHRDCTWPDQSDCCPLGPCRASVVCLFWSEHACFTGLNLSPFLPGVVTGERLYAFRDPVAKAGGRGHVGP